MPDAAQFSPDTTAAIAGARRHGVGDLLRRTAARYPDKLAVVAGERRFTYAEFDAAVNRTAHALAARGAGKGDRLALLSRNCWEFAVVAFATAKLGVVLVPVNFMLGANEIGYILRHSGATGMVAQDALVDTAEQALATAGVAGGVRGRIGGTADGWEDVADWWTAGPDHDPEVAVADDDPLRLMYTSGTESRPKGVLLSSRSLIGQYVSCVIDGGMDADDVEVHSLPMYHCAQLDCFFSVDVYLGATSVVLPGPDPAALLEAVERERATKLFCPPTVWISLLRHPDFDTRDMSSLRKGYYGASAMPVEVLKELQRRLPEVRFWNFYGRPRWRRSPRSCVPTSSCRRRARPGGPRSTSRRCSSTTRASRCARARSARSCTAARTPRSVTTTTRTRPPRRSAVAGSTRATSGSWTRTATSPWSTARRT
ncbi:MAG TPA: AMP-binding protein [Pseudonocardia sp.]|nr:AMP-binding protein [Pseudonocardia sp.]